MRCGVSAARNPIPLVTLTGRIETITGDRAKFGFADGPGHSAKFNCISDLVLTADGKTTYVLDGYNDALRQVDLATGHTQTLVVGNVFKRGSAKGNPTVADLPGPIGLVFDPTTSALETALFITCFPKTTLCRVDLSQTPGERVRRMRVTPLPFET